MSSSTGRTRFAEGSRTIGGPELTAADRAALLRLARETLTAYLTGRPIPAVPHVPGAVLRRGAFVTLSAGGALRGCIGHLAGDRALGDVVRDMTIAAARDDPRFAPVALDELSHLALEISVLSEPAAVTVPVDPERVTVGRDGLIVRGGGHVGVLLPQVAAEYHWGSEAFLAAACRKAGLPPDAWREPTIEVLTFQADVFGETEVQERGEEHR